MGLSDDNRVAIITAAAAAAGSTTEPGFEKRLEDAAVKLTTLSSPFSWLGKKLDRIAESKVIVGVLRSITKEESSTRGLVTIETRPSKFHPDGLEEQRTERTDRQDGFEMAEKLSGLVGHRVALYVYLEPIGDGETKIRVVQHAVDLGEPRG